MKYLHRLLRFFLKGPTRNWNMSGALRRGLQTSSMVCTGTAKSSLLGEEKENQPKYQWTLIKNLGRLIWHKLVLHSLMLDPCEQVILIKLKKHYNCSNISIYPSYIYTGIEICEKKFSWHDNCKDIMGEFCFSSKKQSH